MTATDDNSAADHAYFRAIEEVFIRLRGAPLLLSPTDWQIARGWHRTGIPLDVVCSTLEELFRQRAEAGKQSTVRSLSQGRAGSSMEPLDYRPAPKADAEAFLH